MPLSFPPSGAWAPARRRRAACSQGAAPAHLSRPQRRISQRRSCAALGAKAPVPVSAPIVEARATRAAEAPRSHQRRGRPVDQSRALGSQPQDRQQRAGGPQPRAARSGEMENLPVMPCAIDFYKVQHLVPQFYEFEEYARLVEAAGRIDTRTHVAILRRRRGATSRGNRGPAPHRRRPSPASAQGGGQRLEGHHRCPEGRSRPGRPLDRGLVRGADEEPPYSRRPSPYPRDGSPVPGHRLRDWVERAQRRADLEPTGNVHILRNMFCSHLAMRGRRRQSRTSPVTSASRRRCGTCTCRRASVTARSACSTGRELTEQ